MKKKTHEEYVEDLKIKNPNVIVLEKYINANIPILHKCLIDGHEWKAKPGNVLHGTGCPECKKRALSLKKKKSHEDYKNELLTKNPSIEVIDKYTGSNTAINHKCLRHNVIWKMTPSNALKGCGCKLCGIEKYSSSQKKTHNEYVNELNNINPNLKVLGMYINASTPITHCCMQHNIEFKISPTSALKGCGCEMCRIEKLKETKCKTRAQYIKELHSLNKNMILLGDYTNTETKTLHKCLLCRHEWMAKPGNVLHGTGCPRCNSSKGENNISKIFDLYNIKYEIQKKFKDCKDINVLPFDFYLPDYNVAIEYQGKQHYIPVEHFGGDEGFICRQRHDNIKREYCKNNNINLLEISYTEFDNIEQILLNYLKLYGFKKQ